MSWIRLFGPFGSRLNAVVDVGSHSIKALAFDSKSGSAPRVVKKFATHLALNASPAQRVARLREFLSVLVQKLCEIPGRTVVAIGPHLAEHSFGYWQAGRSIAGAGMAKAEAARIFQQLLEAHHPASRLAMAYPLEIYANGYPASFDEIASGNVKDIGFATLLMQLSEDAGNGIASLSKSLGGMPLEFIPLPAAYGEALARADIRDAVLLDIGGEETAGLLVRDGALRSLMTFPIGANHFLRTLARETDASLQDLERDFRGYAQGMDGSSTRRAAIHGEFQKKAEEWQRGFTEALEGWYTQGPLPSLVLLTGGGARIPEIADVLRNPSWLAPFSHAESVSLRVWDGPAMFGGSSLKGMLAGPEDAGLGALIVYSMYRKPLF